MRIRLRRSGIDSLAADAAVLRAVREVADAVADEMRRRAPKRTGAAAASIHAEPATRPSDGFLVSWDREHFYLTFAEFGTESESARPFARPVADEFNRRKS